MRILSVRTESLLAAALNRRVRSADGETNNAIALHQMVLAGLYDDVCPDAP